MVKNELTVKHWSNVEGGNGTPVFRMLLDDDELPKNARIMAIAEFEPGESMESQFGGILNTIYMEDFRTAPYSLAAINAYFHLKNLEVAKVVTAMECIRYGYSPEVITRYINQKKGVL